MLPLTTMMAMPTFQSMRLIERTILLSRSRPAVLFPKPEQIAMSALKSTL
jgi:hypothetical protein